MQDIQDAGSTGGAGGPGAGGRGHQSGAAVLSARLVKIAADQQVARSQQRS